MKTMISTVALVAATLMSLNVQAQGVEDWARVKSVEPIYEQGYQRPRQTNCNVQRQRQVAPPSNDVSLGGSIAGTVIGGLIGSQFGKGEGRVAMAGVGAAAGALIGNQVGRESNQYQNNPGSWAQEYCHPEVVQIPVSSYRVVLEYKGQDFVYQMSQPPRSDSVRVQVNITPVLY